MQRRTLPSRPDPMRCKVTAGLARPVKVVSPTGFEPVACGLGGSHGRRNLKR